MSAPIRRFASKTSPLVFALLLVTPLVIGTAAALLVGPVLSPGTKTVAPPRPIDISLTLIAELVLGALAVAIAVRVFRLIRGDVPAISASGFLVVAMMVFLIAIVLIFALRFVGGGNLLSSKSAPPTLNGSGGLPGGNLTNHSRNLSNALPVLGFQLPAWTFYVALAGIAVAVGAALIPLMIARGEARTKPSVPVPFPGRFALRAALSELEGRAGDDPRTQIILVYGRLLQRVGAGLGDLSTLTPREIELACRRLLGIGPQSAHVLTLLFEEARYSAHAVGPDLAERARAALKQALSDLDRKSAPWAA